MSETGQQKEVEREVRALLDAMDRQYGAPLFSARVDEARAALRRRFPAVRDLRDKSRERKAS